jgi:Glycosyl hydrolase family 79 C-terminal beta domain
VNAAFSLTSRGLDAGPLLYGLILFARTLGPDAQLVPVHLRGDASTRVKAWAVRLRSGALHVLLINKSSRTATINLRLPVAGTASVERLRAPSASSRSGVTLGGQHLSATGAWLGSPSAELIMPGARGYEVTLPGTSAALVQAAGAPQVPSR